MTNQVFHRCNGGCDSFVWKAGAIVGVWALAACTVSGLILVPERNALLFAMDLLTTVAVVVGAAMVTMFLLRCDRTRKCNRRPGADARRIIEQAEGAIANGGRGIDITNMPDDELMRRMMQMSERSEK